MSDDADELEGLGWEALESAADTSDPEVAAAYLELANAAAHESRRVRRSAVRAQEEAQTRADEERRAATARRREEDRRKQDERRAQEAKRQTDERRGVEARARAQEAKRQDDERKDKARRAEEARRLDADRRAEEARRQDQQARLARERAAEEARATKRATLRRQEEEERAEAATRRRKVEEQRIADLRREERVRREHAGKASGSDPVAALPRSHCRPAPSFSLDDILGEPRRGPGKGQAAPDGEFTDPFSLPSADDPWPAASASQAGASTSDRAPRRSTAEVSPPVASSPQAYKGAELSTYRRERGLTQSLLAREMGVSQGTIAKAEGAPDQLLGPVLQAAFHNARRFE
jgi:hypothetical protein